MKVFTTAPKKADLLLFVLLYCLSSLEQKSVEGQDDFEALQSEIVEIL